MGSNRFQRLARELAKRDADLVDGLEKARLGLTTLGEVAKATTVIQIESPLEQRRLIA